MAAVIKIEVTQDGNLKSLKDEVDDVAKGADKLGDSAKNAGGKFSLLTEIATGAARAAGEAIFSTVSAATAAVGQFVSDGIEAAKGTQILNAATTQVLESTGNAAGVTAQHIADLATELSDANGKSLFGDDQIQASENLLLTFTNLHGAVLDSATAMSVDMAQALGGEPKAQAIALGKALNDPIKGVTALTKVGVTFTDQQRAQIQAMQETGDMAGAQGVILAELNREFGGQGAAAAAAAGPMVQFKARLGEIGETIGTALLPMLGVVGGVLNDRVAPAIEAAAAAFAAWLGDPATQAGIAQVTDAITNGLGVAMDYLSTTVIPALLAAWNGIQPTLVTVGAYITDTIIPGLQTFADFVTTNASPILAGLGTVLVAVVVPAFLSWAAAAASAAVATAIALAPVVIPILAIGAAAALLYEAWQTDFGGIQEKTAAVWAAIQPAFDAVVQWLGTNIPVAIQAAAAFWTGTLEPALNSVWAFITQSVIPTLTTLVTGTFATVNAGIQTLSAYWAGTLQPALNAVWTFLNTYVIPIFNALANVAIALVKKEVELLAALWNNVLKPALSAVWEYVNTNVMPILNALATVAIAALKTAVKELSDLWTGTLKPALDAVVKVVSDTLSPALNTLSDSTLGGVKESLNYIGDAAKDVISWFNDLAHSIDAIEIPDWLKGHSPPPLANWLDFIGDAAGGVASVAIPGLISAFQSMKSELPNFTQMVTDIGGAALEVNSKKWDNAARTGFSDALTGVADEVAKLGSSISDTIADTFSGAASLDRVKAKAIDALKDISAAQQKNVQDQLTAADAAASKMADPAQAAKFLKLKSDQIFEIAKLQDQVNAETDATRKKQLEDQVVLIMDAQKNEMASLNQRAATTSPVDTLLSSLAKVKSDADAVLKKGGSQFALPAEFDGNSVINALRALTSQLNVLTTNNNSTVNSDNSVFNYQPVQHIVTSAPVPQVDPRVARALAGGGL